MRYRLIAFLLATTAALPPMSKGRQTLPRTPDGQPDIQGIWTNATLTPLERPPELRNKPFFTCLLYTSDAADE